MKKWLLVTAVCLLILLFGAYFLIPGSVSIHQSLSTSVNPRSVQRVMLDDQKLGKWWPGETQHTSGGQSFVYNGYTYSIIDRKLTTVDFLVSKGNFSTNASLNFIPLSLDSVQFSLVAEKSMSSMPVKRIQTYFQATQLSKDFKALLQAMHSFFSNPVNIYDFPIEKTLVTDSILISTSRISKGLPTTESVYELIEKLKTYAGSQGAKQTGYPMLNINTNDSLTYLTRVALPVDKKLPSSGDIEYRWMLGGGNILITEVKGGPGIMKAALHQMENYISDHNRIPPAIPFQSLITDRSKEKDTSKWITRIYYPVM